MSVAANRGTGYHRVGAALDLELPLTVNQNCSVKSRWMYWWHSL